MGRAGLEVTSLRRAKRHVGGHAVAKSFISRTVESHSQHSDKDESEVCLDSHASNTASGRCACTARHCCFLQGY